MLQLLDVNKYVKGLTPITSLEYYSKEENYHPEGLFSETIFGPEGTKERRNSFSYIELHTKIIHPSIFKILKQLDRKIEKFISTEESFSLDSNKQLQIDDSGVTGYTEFIKMFPQINFRGGGTRGQRDKYIKLLNKSYKNNTLFIDKIPVMSPEFRPIYKDENNQLVEDKLNEKYLTIMKRVRNIKNIQPGPLYDLICYGIHQAVMDHNLYVLTKINKKDGHIRKNLLGKRTDFSGRGVITPDPKIGLNEVGVPLRMALALFEPFIIYQLSHLQGQDAEKFRLLMREYKQSELSIESVKNLIESLKNGDDIPPVLYDILWKATEQAMIGRYVIIKRDPALHDTSYRGVSPKLVKSTTILLCPLTVGGFNADFDGDTMGIFHPLSNESQKEIKEKMMRFKTATNSSSISFGLTKEMSLGIFTLTKDIKMNNSPVAITDDDLNNIKELYMMVKYRGNITTAGRAILNSCFPPDFPFINKLVTTKEFDKIVGYTIDNYSYDVVKKTMTKVQQILFKWATLSGSSFSLSDMKLPPNIIALKNKLKTASVSEANVIIKEIEKLLIIHLRNTGLGDLVDSGASRGGAQIRQIMVAKGLIADTEGNIFKPIAEAYGDGLTSSQQFNTSYGVRTGIVNRVVTTADTGYASRKLAYLLNRVEVHPTLKDCGTNKYFILKLNSNIIKKLNGRYVVEKGKLVEFDSSKYKTGDVIKLRSPIYCKSPQLCHACYGRLIERMRSPYVGIYAAQQIGEAGTQTTMKKFHTGGAVTLKNKDILQDILDNDPITNFVK